MSKNYTPNCDHTQEGLGTKDEMTALISRTTESKLITNWRLKGRKEKDR